MSDSLQRVPDWRRIDHVLLDMDGTLLDLHFDTHFWCEHLPLHLSERNGLSLEEAKSDLTARCNAVRSRLEWYCLDYWAGELGFDLLPLKHELRHRIALHRGAEHFLSAVRTAGKRLLLVTNAHRGSLDLKLEQTLIGDRFDRIVVSHDFALAKEDPAFWPRLALTEPFDPSRTLFIDDNLDVLRTARDYGIAHLYAVRRPDTRGEAMDTEEFPAVEDFARLLPEISCDPRS